MKLGEVCPTHKRLSDAYATASILYVQKLAAFKDAVVSPDHDFAFAEVRRVWQVCEDARGAIEQHVNECHCDERQTRSAAAG